MQQTLTAKIRLYPTHEQIALFKAVTKEYQRLCNIVSQWYFDGYFNANQKVFQKDMYHYLRNESPKLNSQMVQSTYRTVKARYDTVRTQLYQHPYRYDTGLIDEKTGKHIWESIPRTLEWLWKMCIRDRSNIRPPNFPKDWLSSPLLQIRRAIIGDQL